MIVVTGAAGQVGTVLVRSLLEKNERVKAIVTPEVDLTSIEAKNITIVKALSFIYFFVFVKLNYNSYSKGCANLC